MKKYLLIALVLLVNFHVKAQVNGNKEPFMSKSFNSGSFFSTRVQTSGGNIVVTGVDASESKVEVYITSNNGKNSLTKEEIQQRLNELYDLDISVNNNVLVAVAKSKTRIKDWKKALSIGFKLFVPKAVASELKTSGGNISLANLSGNQDFTTSGGNLDIDNVSGKINGKTSGGNINLKNSKNDIDLVTSGGNIDAVNSEGKLCLSTSGGSLYLKDLKGDIKATTSGGNVDGKNIAGELFASTSGGNVRLDDLACSIETSTSGGNIYVALKEFGKYVTLSNSGGQIELEIPKGKGADLSLAGSKIKTDRLENFSGKIKDDEVDGKLNGGGVPVKVRAGGGHVSLALR
jgi:hypothetical protein